ncbi:MAG: glycosyltransferase N-terminal domain-containing protein [Rhodomicrobium sp.]|jgi:3-deoxy-D-manno-octulosonic-acid transferase
MITAPFKKARDLVRRLKQSDFFLDAASGFAARHIRAVMKTSKVIREPADTDSYIEKLHPAIGAMWHGQFLLLPLVKPKSIPINNMVAKHTDGEMIGRTLLHFDMGLIRGAGAGDSGKDRGGAGALRAALKALKSNISVTMTADVPPGPARVAGMGIVTVARLSGRPIVPFAVATGRFITLPTWSRLTINLPFTKLAMVAGKPIYVPRDADESAMEDFRQQVEAALNATTERAYELAGGNIQRTLPKPANVRRSGALLSLYRGATWAARPAAMAILKHRAARGKEAPDRLPERLGHASAPRPDGPLFWFHAASVGETNSILPLMHELKRRYPALNFLLTTITATSARVAASRLPHGAIHQFIPLDSPRLCARFVEHWRPDLGLFTESEIWPNLIVEASGRNVPLVLVNARMSQRSAERWSRLSSLSWPVFSRFDLALAQNWRFAKRLSGLGARNAVVTGNLKYDAPPPPVDVSALGELRRRVGDRPVFLAASTHPGEDEAVVRAHEMLQGAMPSLLTVIAPRHPDRGEAILALLAERMLRAAARSRGETIGAETQVYLADTIGELGLFYSLAPFSFIGGSLVGHGGQNPIEAIKLGSGVLSGPYTFNFAETYSVLQRYGGFRLVTGPDDLAAAARLLFENEGEAAEMKRRAAAAIGTLGGALEKTIDALKPYLPAEPLAPVDARSLAAAPAA